VFPAESRYSAKNESNAPDGEFIHKRYLHQTQYRLVQPRISHKIFHSGHSES
jgi:hypothetical protein